MKSKKLIVSIVVCFITAMLFTSLVSASHNDSPFSFYSINVGYVYSTPEREKDNDTGTYVHYQSASYQPHGTFFSVWSRGINYTRNDAGIILVGTERLIAQYVYENGKRVCNLAVSPRNYNTTSVMGLWSPDSIGSIPYCNFY